MLHEILVVVIGVLIAEVSYDHYRHWQKVRHMRMLNERRLAKKRARHTILPESSQVPRS